VISAANATSATGAERARARQAEQEERWRTLGLSTEGKPFRPGTLHSVTALLREHRVRLRNFDRWYIDQISRG